MNNTVWQFCWTCVQSVWFALISFFSLIFISFKTGIRFRKKRGRSSRYVWAYKSTNPDWNSDGSSDLEIVEVERISSTIKLDVNSSEDEGFPENPFKW